MLKKVFSVPGGITSYQSVVKIIIDLYATKRYLFREDSEIGCVYDSFAGIWNGGRATIPEEQSDDFIREQVNYFNDRGVAFRQIFSNLYIDEFLDDEKCNNILKIISENDGNSVVIVSDKALHVLKERYPNLGFSSSCTKCLLDIDSVIAEHKKDYDDVCVWIKLNYKAAWEQIPEDLRYKTTIMVCQNCQPQCPYVYQGYIRCSLRILEYYGIPVHIPQCTIECHQDLAHSAEEWLNQKVTLRHDKLNELVAMGINHFKITGRYGPVDFVEFTKLLAYYLIDPEKYQEFFDIFEERYKEEKVIKQDYLNTFAKLEFEDMAKDIILDEVLADIEYEDSLISLLDCDLNRTFEYATLKGINRVLELQKNAVYVQTSSLGAFIVTKNNPNFDRMKLNADLALNTGNIDDYRKIMQNVAGIPFSGVYDTNFGDMHLVNIEPKVANSDLLCKSVFWNDNILFIIILRHYNPTSKFASLLAEIELIDFVGMFLRNANIDTKLLEKDLTQTKLVKRRINNE